jgi:hypothetical protein
MADGKEANQEVTNALIMSQLEHMEKSFCGRLDRIEKAQEENQRVMDVVRMGTSAREERLKAVEADCLNLANRVENWNILNSLGVAVATIIAIFWK